MKTHSMHEKIRNFRALILIYLIDGKRLNSGEGIEKGGGECLHQIVGGLHTVSSTLIFNEITSAIPARKAINP